MQPELDVILKPRDQKNGSIRSFKVRRLKCLSAFDGTKKAHHTGECSLRTKTGSYTTIYRHVKEFNEGKEKGELSALPKAEPPDSLIVDAKQLVQSLWQKAWSAAESSTAVLVEERNQAKK